MKSNQNLSRPEIINSSRLNPESLRILFVTARYLPYVGGTEIHTYEVARRIAATGHMVTVLTTDLEKRLPAEEEIDGVRVCRVPAWPAGRDFYFAPGIYTFIQNEDYDVIHCQGYHTLVAPLAIQATRRKGLPYWVTFHSGGHSSTLRNLLRPVQQALLRPLLEGAVGLIGVSKWEVDFFKARMHLPDQKFHLIPNGATLPKFDKPRNIARKSDPLLVSLGRAERYKGHHRVISALPYLIDHYPGIRLRIVGSGAYETALKQLAQDLGIADRVEIRGISSSHRDEMASLLLEAALVILLSEYESQSISITEALALGRPVLVADSTALRELAERGLARMIAPFSPPKEIALAIQQQLEKPLVPVTSSLPTWDDCAANVLALYQNALAGREV